MGGNNKKSATVSVADLTKAYDEALAAQKGLADDAAEEVKTEVNNAVIEAKKQLDKAVDAAKPAPNVKPQEAKELKVRILLPVAGKFLLPYNVEQVVKLPANQAKELVDAEYAEFVK